MNEAVDRETRKVVSCVPATRRRTDRPRPMDPECDKMFDIRTLRYWRE
jgi:hypothetical protein